MGDPTLIGRLPHPSIARLRSLLAVRDHQGFIEMLVATFDEIDRSQHDYLRALGGEGLYVLLREEKTSELLATYAALLISRKIHAPANVVLALNERVPSAELIQLANSLTFDTDVSVRESLSMPTDCRNNELSLGPIVQVKRHVQIMDMGFGTYSASDALGIKRSIFRSEQERTFMQAVSLRFPGLIALPNYPLDQVADFHKLEQFLDAKTLRYGKNCRVDAILVVPCEGDPVAAFELDSNLHDDPTSKEKDHLKNRLFQAIQIPFFRIRVEACISMAVDEWYALLTDEILDKVDCGRRLRIRTPHSTLIPL